MKINNKSRKWITLGVLAVAFGLIVMGISRGEPSVVLTKATSICLQCIGLD